MRKNFFLIFLLFIFIIFSVKFLFELKKQLNVNVELDSYKDESHFNKKKYLVECKLFNEIIDRKKLTMKDNVITHAQRKIMLELTLVLASHVSLLY